MRRSGLVRGSHHLPLFTAHDPSHDDVARGDRLETPPTRQVSPPRHGEGRKVGTMEVSQHHLASVSESALDEF